MDINIVSRADVTMGIDELSLIKTALEAYINQITKTEKEQNRALILFNEIKDKLRC